MLTQEAVAVSLVNLCESRPYFVNCIGGWNYHRKLNLFHNALINSVFTIPNDNLLDL
jgi:hypothetical protein